MTPITNISADAGARPAQVVSVEPTELDASAPLEEATRLLLACDYFSAAELLNRSLDRARRARDYRLLARICLPLQEARRFVRQSALDARTVHLVRTLATKKSPRVDGLYVLEPPLIGADGKALRETLWAARVHAMVLVKEPTTSAGKWPIVGVGNGDFERVVARVQVDPPEGLKLWREKSLHGADLALITPAWFSSVQEALGDAAIRKVSPAWPAQHRVEDLCELLDAVPDHEKLIQTLAQTAVEASVAPPCMQLRRRPVDANPYSF